MELSLGAAHTWGSLSHTVTPAEHWRTLDTRSDRNELLFNDWKATGWGRVLELEGGTAPQQRDCTLMSLYPTLLNSVKREGIEERMTERPH